ncbi:MAG: DNA-directed RNA polymerase subunit L [Candidatus Diapherotrites archaeon]|nr:DNA-directed RNA polymerase subunit L [Candidatus Diapherotrites archaeon]
MEIEILRMEKDLLEFKMKGERHTYPQLLKHYLLKNPDVAFAAYKLEHPLNKDSLFIVKVKKGNPLQALKDANKEIIAEIDEFEQKLKEALK